MTVHTEKGFTWYPERQLGYYPVSENGRPVYDQGYFDKYVQYADTELGRALTAARVALVQRHLPQGTIIDVGIGAGTFVDARRPLAPTFGYDINPAAVAWLGPLWRDPLAGRVDGLTYWDSLEHLAHPGQMLHQANWHFLSLPIFTGPEHALASKHFRPMEHYWYFTRPGLIRWFAELGFRCLEYSAMESLLGREDIYSFVFARE